MNAALLTLTIVHVLLSLAGIAAGFVVIAGWLRNQNKERWTALFLATTVATSASGFLFPITRLTPGLVLGVISLVVLAVAAYAYYFQKLHQGWRQTYVLTALAAQYLNFFVLIVQSFLKVPALRALAPTQTEPAFVSSQLVALLAFAALAVLSWRRFEDSARQDSKPTAVQAPKHLTVSAS